ncbi:MAG: phosphatidylglycerophosphatase A [Kiritimatiellae bacterium]|nr:phosphatidylglycerophosphatase A [Kiritimatiellia bacterium]
MKNRLWVALATGFGLGYSPIAPGTVGSLWGILIVWGMQRLPTLGLYIMVMIGLVLLAIPLCTIAENRLERKDDQRIVADEFFTFPLCMTGLPFTPSVLIVAFITNRIFDISKPPPAQQSQNLPGGLGIVMDDVIACLYSLVINHAIYWAGLHFLSF